MAHLTEIQLIRTEGIAWEDACLGCYISADNELIDVITPINALHEENTVLVRQHSNLRFILKTMTDIDQYLGSVTIPVSRLPPQGLVWLPLLSEMENDFISTIPLDLPNPKILISIAPSTPESQVPGGGTQGHCELRVKKAVALQELLSKKLEISETEKLVLNANCARLENTLCTLQTEAQELRKGSSQREECLVTLLEQRDIQISELENSFSKSERSSHSLQSQNNSLLQRLNSIETPDNSLEIAHMQDIIRTYRETIEKLEKSLKDIGDSYRSCEEQETQSLVQENESLLQQLARAQERTNVLTAQYERETELQARTLKEELTSLQKEHKETIAQLKTDLKTVRDEYAALYRDSSAKSSCLEAAIESLHLPLLKSHANSYFLQGTLLELALINNRIYVEQKNSYIALEEYLCTLTEETLPMQPLKLNCAAKHTEPSKNENRTRRPQRRVRGSETTLLARTLSSDHKLPFK